MLKIPQDMAWHGIPRRSIPRALLLSYGCTLDYKRPTAYRAAEGAAAVLCAFRSKLLIYRERSNQKRPCVKGAPNGFPEEVDLSLFLWAGGGTQETPETPACCPARPLKFTPRLYLFGEFVGFESEQYCCTSVLPQYCSPCWCCPTARADLPLPCAWHGLFMCRVESNGGVDQHQRRW